MEKNIPIFNQKKVAFQFVKKLPDDLNGQISRNIEIIIGIIKIEYKFSF